MDMSRAFLASKDIVEWNDTLDCIWDKGWNTFTSALSVADRENVDEHRETFSEDWAEGVESWSILTIKEAWQAGYTAAETYLKQLEEDDE